MSSSAAYYSSKQAHEAQQPEEAKTDRLSKYKAAGENPRKAARTPDSAFDAYKKNATAPPSADRYEGPKAGDDAREYPDAEVDESCSKFDDSDYVTDHQQTWAHSHHVIGAKEDKPVEKWLEQRHGGGRVKGIRYSEGSPSHASYSGTTGREYQPRRRYGKIK